MDFNFLNVLEQMSKGNPASPLAIDPRTGQPLIAIPENSKEAKAFQKQLSPTKKEEPIGKNPQVLDTTLPQPVPEDLLNTDKIGWDKEQVKRLLLEERAGVEQLSQDARQYRGMPTGIDWKPLASFVGTMVKGGEKLADYMPDVDTPEQKAYKAQQLENMVQNQKGDVTKNALALLQSELDKQSLKQTRFEQSQLYKKEENLQKDLNKTLFTPMSNYDDTMFSMEDQISRGTLSSIGTAISNYTRGVAGQKGVLTDNDIALVLPKSIEASLTRAQAWITGNPNLPLPREMVDALMREITVARQNAKKVYQKKFETMQNLYSARNSMRDVMDPLTGAGPKFFDEAKSRLETFGTAPTLSAPTAGTTIPTLESIQAEMRRRKGT